MELEALIKEINSSKSTLKIITKTKNERFFIEKWIQHHLAIIGEGKLIIFDNMSDDEYVLNIYQKYKKNIILIKFGTYPDDIHNYILLKPFYQAIKNSTDFFTILDSDEYLYLYDAKENKVIHDTSILEFLKENNDCDFFAPCWLANKEKYENILNLTSELPSCFEGGKPIIHTRILDNTQLKNTKFVMFRHTSELLSLQYVKSKTAFLIAHLKNLSLDQRIETNMNKLAATGLIKSNISFYELLCLPINVVKNKAVQGFIKETIKLVTLKTAHGDYCPSAMSEKENTITIEEDASLTFSHTFSKHAFRTLMKRSYLDLIEYDSAVVNPKDYPTLRTWIDR